MRKGWFLLLFLISVPLWSQQGFVLNDGQWEHPGKFVLRQGPNAIFFTPDSIVFSILDPADFHPEHQGQTHHYEESLTYANFSMVFDGAVTMDWQGDERLEHYNNFFVGHSRFWRSKVPSFEKLRAKNVYPGIDLLFYQTAGGLKFDWILAPGADPATIEWHYNGLTDLKVQGKKLQLNTGAFTLEESMPWAYQDEKDVKCRYENREDRVGFSVSKLDREKSLIIDPIYIFSTYSGSTADNFGYTATFDQNGHAFGGGIVWNTGYPTTLGAFDTTYNGGIFDAALSKFSSDGSQLLWSSYLGGSHIDQPHSIDCDEFGNLYVLGSTGSSDFATTPNALDTSFGGGPTTTVEYYTFSNGADAFVSKISPTGTALLASTYLGGLGNDGVNGALHFNYGDGYRGEIEVQLSGGPVYIATSSDSTGMPVSTGQTEYQGRQDGYFAVFNRGLDQLLSATYVGSAGNEGLYSLSLANKAGNGNNQGTRVFLTGPIQDTSGAFSYSSDSVVISQTKGTDGLLVALFSNDTLLRPLGLHISSDTVGKYNQHFFVETNFPSDTSTIVTTMGQDKGGVEASDTLFWGQPGSAQYIMELKLDTVSKTFNPKRTMVFGDSSKSTVDISPTAMMVDFCGNVYLSGWGGSPNTEGTTDGLVTTANAIKSTTDGRDFYFLVMEPSWKNASLATYFGGSGREHVDGGTSRFDSKGRIFQAVCAGCGGTSSYPAFPSNAYSLTNNSFNCNLAVTVIDLDVQTARAEVSAPVEFCYPGGLALSDSSENVDIWYISWGDGQTAISDSTLPGHFYGAPGTYNVQLIGNDSICNTWDTTSVQIDVLPPHDSVFIELTYQTCDTTVLHDLFAVARYRSDSSLVDVSGTGGYQISWSYITATGASYTGQGNSFVNPMGKIGTNILSVSVFDPVCGVTEQYSYPIVFARPASVGISFEVPDCASNNPAIINAMLFSADSYNWFINGAPEPDPQPLTLNISQSGTYEITLVGSENICGTSDTATQIIDVYYADTTLEIPNVITPNGDNLNDTWYINSSSQDWLTFKVKVFNRWGTKVFETSAPTFNWGADYDGQILSPGVYFYLIEGTTSCGPFPKKEGTLTISY